VKKYLEWGKEVLSEEARAISSLEARLGDEFAEAVKLVRSCRGKVIVSGLGKSGHVGKKIAASLASLATPSFFMHSTETLHGDAGMMEPRDVLIAISNSGSTAEVVSAAQIAKSYGLKVIAMTGNKNSPLGKTADVWLDIGIDKEADPLDLAPTSSSTVTLALGDALAVAVARSKDFKKSDFAYRHPGGALGKKSKK